MAYRDDIIGLGADHLYIFDGNVNDSVSAINATAVGTIYTSSITEDATQAVQTNGVSDSVDLPSTNNINLLTDERHAVSIWVRFNSIQTPPKIIYADGGTTAGFKLLMGMGNNLMLECANDNEGFIVQIYGPVLEPNRTYHICGIFESELYGNIVRLYVDGVRYLNSNPTDASPNGDLATGRSQGAIGSPIISNNQEVGGQLLIQNSPVTGTYQFLSFWGNKPQAQLTDSEVREILFEKGCKAGVTITSDTQINMQAQLDSLANTIRPDEPLNIRVEEVQGGGDFTLTSNNIVHNEKASIHVQYQGTGTLSWINTNGSNSSIGSTPNSGTINFINPSVLTVEPLITGTEIRILEANTLTEIGGIESSGTSFSTTINAASVDLIVHSLQYETIRIEDIDLTAGDVTVPISQVLDRQYGNL